MTMRQRARLIWHIIRGDSLAIIADRISQLPRSTIENFADQIAHQTQAVITGVMQDMASHTTLLNELMERMVNMEMTQRDILAALATIDSRLERGNVRFDAIDAQLKLQHEDEVSEG